MAEENLKEFATNWIIISLLSFCLISFSISFMYSNNPIGLDDGSNNNLLDTQQNLNTKLYSIDTESDKVLNIYNDKMKEMNPDFTPIVDSTNLFYQRHNSVQIYNEIGKGFNESHTDVKIKNAKNI